MNELPQDRPAIYEAEEHLERPAIHIALAKGVNEAFSWGVAIGAEEEGIPCRQVSIVETDVIELAYAAAQSSRLSIGVGITQNEIAIHEFHMPTNKPVLHYQLNDNLLSICRLAGCNAARLVVGVPLLFDE